ncbi:MAG: winged helix-turn-helix domain-containing protein [Anaerolineales bacterium]
MSTSRPLFDESAFPQAAIRHESLAYVTRCLSIGQCCAVVGLSNTGKSTLLRSLQRPSARVRCAQPGRSAPFVVFVDALDGAVPTEPSFYELALRRLIQSAAEYGATDGRLADVTRLHAAVLAGAAPLACRAYFAQAVHSLIGTNAAYDIVIVLDNFDDLLCELDAAPLRHLRALRDAYGARLSYVLATTRPPDELRRDDATYEFIELFQVYTHHLPPLTSQESETMLDYLYATTGSVLSPALRELAIGLAGGHPGLLDRICRTLVQEPALATVDEADAVSRLLSEPPIAAECSRLIRGLSHDELLLLQRSVSGQGSTPSSLPPPRPSASLSELGAYVVRSPLLRAFVTAYHTADVQRSGVRCDLETGQIWLDGQEITLELSEAQRRLLRHLYRHQGRVCGQQSIAEVIWDTADGVSPGAIYELVKRVRQKIEVDWRDPRLLITVPGEGYRLESPQG